MFCEWTGDIFPAPWGNVRRFLYPVVWATGTFQGGGCCGYQNPKGWSSKNCKVRQTEVGLEQRWG